MNTLYTEQARFFAMKAHGNQKYGEDQPYIVHLEATRGVVVRFVGEHTDDLQAAALLHDVLEDTATNFNDLVRAFNVEIAELVYAVTDELGRNRKERHERTYPKIAAAGISAITIKLADRIANVEHALKTGNKRMLHLYWEEHTGFHTALFKPDGPQNMWAHLNNILLGDWKIEKGVLQ